MSRAPETPGVELRPHPLLGAASPGTVCAVVGSFDPLHRGHMWMVDQLLSRFDVVALLVPARHFTKTVRPPRNATLAQRLDMIQRVYGPDARVLCGVAHEVLFVRLAACLERRFPGARITFGMGNDTFALLLDSARYFRRLGLPWGPAEQERIAELCRDVVVFGRSRSGGRYEQVPGQMRGLSSTLARRAAGDAAGLHRMVAGPVADYIQRQRLYC